MTAVGFDVRSQIIWAKDRFALSRGHYHWQHEPCWYAVRNGPANWTGDRKQSTLWQIPAREGQGFEHGTQKPVECMKRPIENNSSPGQAIYEPFCGSGTTIIAAEITGRSCHAIELMPQYVDVAVERWQAFTGETAKLEGDGRTLRGRRGRAPARGGAVHEPPRAPARSRAAPAGRDDGGLRHSGGRDRAAWSASIPRRCASITATSSISARPRPTPRWPASCSTRPRNGNVTAQIFWLKTRARWKETPSEHWHSGAIGTFDIDPGDGCGPATDHLGFSDRLKVIEPSTTPRVLEH